MTIRDVRKRRQNKERGRPPGAPKLDLRVTRMSSCGGMHVAYSAGMAGGRIDREAWAGVVQRLMVQFDPGPRGDGNKSAFARRLGRPTRTVERWINRQVDVKIETVYSVVDTLDLGPQGSAEVLAEIGIHVSAPISQDPRDDPIIREILADPRWTEAQRTQLVQAQLDRIEADRERRRAEYEQLQRLYGSEAS